MGKTTKPRHKRKGYKRAVRYSTDGDGNVWKISHDPYCDYIQGIGDCNCKVSSVKVKDAAG